MVAWYVTLPIFFSSHNPASERERRARRQVYVWSSDSVVRHVAWFWCKLMLVFIRVPRLAFFVDPRSRHRDRSSAAVPCKTYTAVLEGRMAKTPKSGEVSAKIRPDPNNRPKQVRSLLVYQYAHVRGRLTGQTI